MSGDIVAWMILALISLWVLIVVAMAAGRPTGRYATVGGGQILAASLAAPKRGDCRSCRRKRAGR